MAALRRVLAIALLDLRRAYAKPLALVVLVLLPALAALGLVALVGAVSGPTAPPVLVVVDEAGGPAAAAFVDALEAVPFTVVPSGRRPATEAVAAGQLRFAVVVPAGFGRDGVFDLEVLGRVEDLGDGEPAIAGWARAVAGRLAAGLPAAGPLSEREAPRGGAPTSDAVPMRLALAVFVLASLTILIARGAAFQRERAAGRLARTVASGVPASEVVAAFVVALLIAGGVQALAFFGTTAALGMPWFAGGVGALLATVVATLLAVAGLAAAITGFARTEAQVMVWSYIAPSLLAMLGGAFWPLDASPAALQQIARLSPVYWSLQALEGGTVFAGWSTQVGPLALLALVGVVGMVAGAQALRRADL